MNLLEVPISRIDREDRTFAFRGGRIPDDLCESVQRRGILAPLMLLEKSPRHVVLSGHRRLACALRAGLATIPAFLLDSHTVPMSELLFLLLDANRFGPPLRLLESARLLSLFHIRAGLDRTALETEVAPLLGLPKGREALERLLALPAMEQEILEDAEAKDGILLALAGLPAPARLVLFRRWIRPRRPSVQEVRQAVEWLLDLSAREGTPPPEILSGPPAERCLERGRGFLAALREVRFPDRSRARRAFDVAARRLPGGVDAKWTSRMEDDRIEFRIQGRSPEEIRGLCESLAGSGDILEAVYRSLCELPHHDACSSNGSPKDEN